MLHCVWLSLPPPLSSLPISLSGSSASCILQMSGLMGYKHRSVVVKCIILASLLLDIHGIIYKSVCSVPSPLQTVSIVCIIIMPMFQGKFQIRILKISKYSTVLYIFSCFTKASFPPSPIFRRDNFKRFMNVQIYEEYFDWLFQHFNNLRFSLYKMAIIKWIYVHACAWAYVNPFGKRKFINPVNFVD